MEFNEFRLSFLQPFYIVKDKNNIYPCTVSHATIYIWFYVLCIYIVSYTIYIFQTPCIATACTPHALFVRRKYLCLCTSIRIFRNKYLECVVKILQSCEFVYLRLNFVLNLFKTRLDSDRFVDWKKMHSIECNATDNNVWYFLRSE